jgi:hypothetical protein
MTSINDAQSILQATARAREQVEAVRRQNELAAYTRSENVVLESCRNIDQQAVDAARNGKNHVIIEMPCDFLDYQKTSRINDYIGAVIYPVFKSQEITQACRDLEAKGYTLLVLCGKGKLQLQVYITEEPVIGNRDPLDYAYGDYGKLKEIIRRQFSPTTTQEQRLIDLEANNRIRYIHRPGYR